MDRIFQLLPPIVLHDIVWSRTNVRPPVRHKVASAGPLQM